MWVFAPFGILMPALRPPHTVAPNDDRVLQVRARRRKDLQILKDKYMPELGEIFQLPNTDYEWRAYCTLEQWGAALAKIGMDIDYVKFKEQSEKKYGDRQLYSLYNRLWSVIFGALSSKKHQDDYWSGALYSGTDTEVAHSWDDFDAELPVRHANGNIDHSHCTHGNSRNARARCRRRHHRS